MSLALRDTLFFVAATSLTFLCHTIEASAQMQNPVDAVYTVYYRRNGVDYMAAVPLYSKHWLPDLEPWNGKVTAKKNRIQNLDTTGLGFPIEPNGVNITADEVSAYWYQTYQTNPVSPPSWSANCHGFSTGLGYWCEGMTVVLADEWQACNSTLAFAVGNLTLESGGAHSVKITKVEDYGTIRVITETQEKNGVSGVYKKSWAAPGGKPIPASAVYRKKTQ